MQTLVLDMSGMTCGGRTGSVQRALSNLDGIGPTDGLRGPDVATVLAESARITAA